MSGANESAERAAKARAMKTPDKNWGEIARELGVSPRTLRRDLYPAVREQERAAHKAPARYQNVVRK